MTGKTEAATYTHGHHAAVLRAHSGRTAKNSAGYLLPYLKPDMKILDIGCGAGTITVDLATHVPQGHITGLEAASHVLPAARSLAEQKGITNIDFVEGDANGLTYADNTFDVVLCHQVLQHVRDPVGILREMRRVAKSATGIVAAREADYGMFAWYPPTPGLEDWRQLYSRAARHNGGEPDAGRNLHVWAKQAGGFDEVVCSMSAWCYSHEEDTKTWAETWAERSSSSDSALARTARDQGMATEEELKRLAGAWVAWSEDESAWVAVPSAEVVCFKK